MWKIRAAAIAAALSLIFCACGAGGGAAATAAASPSAAAESFAVEETQGIGPQAAASLPPSPVKEAQTESPVAPAETAGQTASPAPAASPAALPSPTAPASAKETQPEQTVEVAVTGPDGELFSTSVNAAACKTAFDALKAACDAEGMELTVSGTGSGTYVKGIGGYKEFDRGPLSGWVYKLNGAFPSVGIGSQKVAAGDSLHLYYTLSMGKDIP